ncbi:MAG TPA: ATP-binding protein [Caulobacteraceae bacterium]|nr:ATP-binding protein [Caulobacteraceae bacterium]
MIRILDEGLDEIAAGHHRATPLRCAVTLVLGLISLAVLPADLCVEWLMLMAALEGWSWVATRAQYLGRPVDRAGRLRHLASHVAIVFAWLSFALAMWIGGGQTGALVGLAVCLSIIFYSQAHAFQSTATVVLIGALPAAAMLAVVALGPLAPGLNRWVVLAALALAVGFAGDGVFSMRRNRQRFEAARARMAESEARYRVLANNVTDVIALTGIDGQRLYISPSIERELGYSVDYLLSQPNYRFLHEDDRARVAERVGTLREPGDSVVLEYRVVRADGSLLWVETSFCLSENVTPGGPPQILSVSRPIEARKAMERDLIEARERAELAAAAKSDFLANMSHELRTPLNAIIGFSGLLQASDRLGEADARSARLIHDASATLLEIVNSVLDFSKLEAGAVELDPQPFVALDEARAVAALVARQAEAKGLTLEVGGAPAAPALMGDAPRLRQVLLNFLSNALKFTSRGGVKVSVTQSPEGDGRCRLRAEVTDTGIGVPKDQLDHVFERFTQADVSVSRRFGGTGLGLAICKRLIDMMDGSIGVVSVEGEGSTFWFEVSLPAADAVAQPRPEAEPASLERPLRLLLVEDVPVNRELVLALLAPFDVDVDCACDGVQGVQAAERTAYDLILMDVQMPVMDGLTAARRIRAGTGPNAAATPIIAMTANVLPEQVAKCLEAGMSGHLGKPIGPARLLETIAAWTSPADTAHPERALSA